MSTRGIIPNVLDSGSNSSRAVTFIFGQISSEIVPLLLFERDDFNSKVDVLLKKETKPFGGEGFSM